MMTVAEFAEYLLATFPHSLPVAVIGTCECCTSLDPVTKEDVGVRCIDPSNASDRFGEDFWGEDGIYTREDNGFARAPTMRLPGLVIGGAGWSHWPHRKAFEHREMPVSGFEPAKSEGEGRS